MILRDQAISAGLTRRAIDHRLSSGQWQSLLPRVYLVHPGEPSRRQMLIAAQLYAGPRSAIDAADACRWHGIKAVSVDESRVHVVEPWGEHARSTGFVVVRRTLAPIRTVIGHKLRFVDPASAVIAATRRMSSDRAVLAALSDALQRDAASYDALLRAHIQGSPRNARRADEALASLAAGARSVPEADSSETGLGERRTTLLQPAMPRFGCRTGGSSVRTSCTPTPDSFTRQTGASLINATICSKTCKNATTP